tara:strand:- start:430 stop:582 length:153 start_codon:yes stop_codon:yes gene_type:complete
VRKVHKKLLKESWEKLTDSKVFIRKIVDRYFTLNLTLLENIGQINYKVEA